MTDIKDILPRDAANITEIHSTAGFKAAAPAAKFKDHLLKDQGQLSEAWSSLGWYEKDTASFAFLAAKTIQAGYSVNTLETRLRVLALLKIIRPEGNGGRMPKRPPEGSVFGDKWPHQRLGYETWGDFVLGPTGGITANDGSYIKGPGLGFGSGIDSSDPNADRKRQLALQYERNLFRGYDRLMELLPESALPHNPEDIRAHYRASVGADLTVEAIMALGKGEKGGTGSTLSSPRTISRDPQRAAATVQKAADATPDPSTYIRRLVEAVAPSPSTPEECAKDLAARYDRKFLEQLAIAIAEYINQIEP